MTGPLPTPGDARPASDQPAILNWLPTIVMNVVLPTVTYFVLNGSAHVKPVPALLISGIWPAVELGYTIWRQRRIDEFSVFVLIGLAVGVVTTVVSRDARAVFLKDWLVWGLFGLVLLASMLIGRPLMFYFGRRFDKVRPAPVQVALLLQEGPSLSDQLGIDGDGTHVDLRPRG